MKLALKLTAVVGAVALALGLAACGGGDDSTSTSAGTGSTSSTTETTQSTTGKGDSKGKKSAKNEGKSASSKDEKKKASNFSPEQHSDSGGGSKQYKVKGGDNSVQEYGAEADQEDFEAAAVALHNFLDARADGNWAAACEYMAESVIESFEKLASQSKQVGGKGCGAILEKLTNPAAKKLLKEEAAKANVGSLRVEGDRSFVIYNGTGKTILAMPMANEDGEWKVASLAGTPLN